MGMGMLFAGALTGGAKAMGEMADDAIKKRERDELRAQTLGDRRAALLEEMELKERFALGQERRDANSYIDANERGRALGDDRRFSKFREDIRATGGGEGMGEDELRKVFNDNYNDKVVAGSDRYYEPESADRRDALQAARSSGASGKVISGLNDEYRSTAQAERQAKQDADRDAREEQRRRDGLERDERRFEQQERLLDKRLGAQAARGGGGGSGASDKPVRFDDAQKAELAPLKRDMEKAADEVAKARPSQLAAAEARAQAARDAYDKKVAEFGGERQKPAATKSAVKDNPTTKPSISSIAGAPSGSSIGAFVGGKGWEVRSGGKLIGYAKE